MPFGLRGCSTVLYRNPIGLSGWSPTCHLRMGGVKRRSKEHSMLINNTTGIRRRYIVPATGWMILPWVSVWTAPKSYRSLVTVLRLLWPKTAKFECLAGKLPDSGRDAWHEPRSLPIIAFLAEFFNNHRPCRYNSRAPAWRAFSSRPVFGHRG